MEVIGRIKVIREMQSFGTNNFTKREMVVTTDDQYPQMIMIEFVQDKCDLLNNFVVGQSVKVSINLRGREWINPEGVAKYFNAIQGWRIENMTQQAAEQSQDNFSPQTTEGIVGDNAEPDDLPF